MSEQIINALELLAEMQAERALMTQEIDVMLAFLETRKESKTEEIDGQIERLTAEIKHLVVEHGKSVKAAVLHAVWSKPRVKWDSKALDGYALNHPELFAFRTEGKASCSIRVRR